MRHIQIQVVASIAMWPSHFGRSPGTRPQASHTVGFVQIQGTPKSLKIYSALNVQCGMDLDGFYKNYHINIYIYYSYIYIIYIYIHYTLILYRMWHPFLGTPQQLSPSTTLGRLSADKLAVELFTADLAAAPGAAWIHQGFTREKWECLGFTRELRKVTKID